MAQPNVVDGRLARVWRGVPGGTGSPYIICALVTKGFQQTKNMNTAVIPDCADPTIVAPVKRTAMSIDSTITGEGYYEPAMRDNLQVAFDDDGSLIWSFELPDTVHGGASFAGFYSGKFFLTTLNTIADEGQYIRAAITWEADGAIVWSALP